MVITRIIRGYGVVIAVGSIAFVAARLGIYQNRDEVIAARERIRRAVEEQSEAEKNYPFYSQEYRKKAEKASGYIS